MSTEHQQAEAQAEAERQRQLEQIEADRLALLQALQAETNQTNSRS